MIRRTEFMHGVNHHPGMGRIDLRMLPGLYKRIERAATRSGMTPPEWARVQLERALAASK